MRQNTTLQTLHPAFVFIHLHSVIPFHSLSQCECAHSRILFKREVGESLRLYEGLTEISRLTGLCTGIFIFSSASFDTETTLLICSGSNFLAFLLSLFLVADPIIFVERGLVNIEKSVSFVHKGATLASKILEGLPVHIRLKMENVYAFCGGLMLFSFATNILFTPLPVFFSKDLNLPTYMVYAIYVSNSAACTVGYFLAGKRLEQYEERARLQKIVWMRSLLAFSWRVLLF